MRIVLVLLVLVTLPFPTATADHACTDATATPAGPIWLGADNTVWRETNQHPGLQRVACEDENGRPIAADARIA
jgi:hypothetical protein